MNSTNPMNPSNATNSMNPNNPQKRILMISYYYPPLTDVGSLRALGFSKYLPLYGWKPCVLSVKNPDKTYCSLGNDHPRQGSKVFYSLSIINLTRILGKLNGLLSKTYKLFGEKLQTHVIANLFGILDILIGWIPLSIIKGIQIMR